MPFVEVHGNSSVYSFALVVTYQSRVLECSVSSVNSYLNVRYMTKIQCGNLTITRANTVPLHHTSTTVT